MLRVVALFALVALTSGQAQNWRDRTQYDPTRVHTHHHQHQTQEREYPSTFEFQTRGAKVHHHQGPVIQSRSHHQGPIDREEVVVPKEYQDAHAAFSFDVLKHQYYAQTVENHGAVSINPFSFAHFLAIIHEKNFDLPVQNIPKILRLPVDQISEAYHIHNEAQKDVSCSLILPQF